MNNKLLIEYLAVRKQQLKDGYLCQYRTGRALQAFRIAKARIKREQENALLTINAGGDTYETRGDGLTELPNGSIQLKIDYDTLGQQDALEDYSIEWKGRRHSSFDCLAHGAPDGWLDRDGSSYGTSYEGHAYRAKTGEVSGYGLGQYLGDARGYYKMGRNDSALYAREMAQKDADVLRRALRGGESSVYFYTVKLFDDEGKELDADCCGGFDDFDYCLAEAESIARGMVKSYAKNIERESPLVRMKARALSHKAASIAQESKLISERVTPNAKRLARDESKRLKQESENLSAQVHAMKEAIKQFKNLGVLK